MTTPAISGANIRIRFRRAWSEDWESINPVLPDGVPGYDKTKNMLKIGDGVSVWNDLPYLAPPESESAPTVVTGDVVVDSAISAHRNDTTPHPVYDDGPSLTLLWQNAKV